MLNSIVVSYNILEGIVIPNIWNQNFYAHITAYHLENIYVIPL